MVHRAHPELDIDEWIDEEEFVPRYNVAPRSRSPVIRRVGADGTGGRRQRNTGNTSNSSGLTVADGASNSASTSTSAGSQPKYVMHTMKWGLVPSWSKHEDKSLSTTNARAENLVEGTGMWNSMRGKKRCAVVCQG